ncbi:proliferating cell nuclear antigen [Rosa chinensis]|uniref:proliferating cell nuclear antigen n=1 Tax=Rosa chinensis TaxID=74649 RepID=UPI000D095F79|nr:proliferating cell nuclear antigen [Rosa chinensis]
MFELQLNQGAVLLRKAVAPLVDLADFADVEISPEEVILLTAGNPAISEEDFVVLRIPESTFARFVCDFAGSFVLNLRRLYSNLNRAGDDDALTIHGDDGDDLIGFVTVNSGTGEFGFSEMELSESYAEGLDLPELDYEYRAIIGIPSEEFRHLIIHLHYFGNSVSVHATDTEVQFSAVNEEVVYRTELGECIIGGVQHEHPVSLIFSLHFLSVILNACLLSNIVWLLQSDDLPPMLNCPVGSIGNLMFYFH